MSVDVYLLADILERERDTALLTPGGFGVDPIHSYGTPGFALQAALKHMSTEGTSFTLFSDKQIEMVDMIEAMRRGGITQVSRRFAKANNPFMPDYDRTKPITWNLYLDANNLYGWAMMQCLPAGNYRYDTDMARWTNEQVYETLMNWADDAPTGGIIEFSRVHVPEHLHDKLSEYPPCPVVSKVDPSWISDKQREWLGDEKDNTTRLLLTLHDRVHMSLQVRQKTRKTGMCPRSRTRTFVRSSTGAEIVH